MSTNTGNDLGLNKIINGMLVASICVLLLHFYYFCYAAFKEWNFATKETDKIFKNIVKTGVLDNGVKLKALSLFLLALNLVGTKGRKEEKATYRPGVVCILTGLVLYFGATLLLPSDSLISILYMVLTLLGYILIMTGGARIGRVVGKKFSNKDPFDKENQGFPQEEHLIETPYSINLRALYTYKEKQRKSWINFINPRRGILILGSPGAGKSYFIIENIIRQLSAKGFALFVYDLKFDDLSRLTYTQFLKHRDKYPPSAKFYGINFSDLSRSHRCNVLDPKTLNQLSDVQGLSRTLFLSVNKKWVSQEGDFWVESAISYFTAIIWYLRKYKNGAYCTLPHAIELAQAPLDKLFTILNAEREIETLINPFVEAYRDGVMEMLLGQVASTKMVIGRLSSKQLYYVLTGNDFTLDINDPASPKIFCLGGDPSNQDGLAPILSVYIDRLNKLINKRNKHRCAVICDEFASLRAPSLLQTMAQARSNDIIPVIAAQDLSQLRTRYSHDEADLVYNISGNLICGQIGGDTARWVSERFPETVQFKTSISYRTTETTFSKNNQLRPVIRPSTIANLSSGEFLGITADDPQTKLELKAFHGRIINDHKALERERKALPPLPIVREVTSEMIEKQFNQVKDEVRELVNLELGKIQTDSSMKDFIVKKGMKK